MFKSHRIWKLIILFSLMLLALIFLSGCTIDNRTFSSITGSFVYCQGVKDPDQACKSTEILVTQKGADGCIQRIECMDKKYTSYISTWGKSLCPSVSPFEMLCLDKNRPTAVEMFDVVTGCKVGVACLPGQGIPQPATPQLPSQPSYQQPVSKEPVSIFRVCTQREIAQKIACLAYSSVKPPKDPAPDGFKTVVERGPGVQGKETIRSFFRLRVKDLSPVFGSTPEVRFREDCPWELVSVNNNRMICPNTHPYKEKVYRQENQQHFCYIGDICYASWPSPQQPVSGLPQGPTIPISGQQPPPIPTIPVQPQPQGVPDLRVEPPGVGFPASTAFIVQDRKVIESYNTQAGKTFDVQFMLFNDGRADAVGPYIEARLLEGSIVKFKQVMTVQGTVLKGSSQKISMTFPADVKPGMYTMEVEAFAVKGETNAFNNKIVLGPVRVSGSVPAVPTQQPAPQPSMPTPAPTMVACGNIQCRSDQNCVGTQVKKKKSKFWKRAGYQVVYSCADKPKPVAPPTPPPAPVAPTPPSTDTWSFLPEYQPGESVYEGISDYNPIIPSPSTPTQTAVSPTPVGPTPPPAPVAPTPAPATPLPAPAQPTLTSVATPPQGEYVSSETSTSTTILPEGFGV